jgi:hypothetical protein
MSINILTFICGIAVGLCSAFILITLVNARRRRFFGVWNRPAAYPYGEKSPSERWREAQPGKRNDEPTELDQ